MGGRMDERMSGWLGGRSGDEFGGRVLEVSIKWLKNNQSLALNDRRFEFDSETGSLKIIGYCFLNNFFLNKFQ